MDYSAFLSSKMPSIKSIGFQVDDKYINPVLFPFQRTLTAWAIYKGRCAIFADTGLGKTLMMLEWSRLMGERTLIIAPLSVARQTVRMAKEMLGLEVKYTRSGEDLSDTINITNYEMIDHFDADKFGAVVLDESSILKTLNGNTRNKLTDMFCETKYRLCCTATPAPNDYVELGNHAEFLGICSEAEMRSMFFVNANKEHTYIIDGKAWRRKGSNKGGTEWRLKHHAEKPFLQWLSSWSISITKPSDLGFDDDGFTLPKLGIHPKFIKVNYTPEDQLFFTHLHGIADRSKIRGDTIQPKLDTLNKIIDGNKDQWIIWAGLDKESRDLSLAFPDAIEVEGADTPEYKAKSFEDFQDGKYQILITKPRIGGFGMNFQNAHNMVFFGLSDSWETYYQCIRREYRFGQTRPVNVYIIMTDLETEIYQNVMRKDAMAKRLRQSLIEHIRSYEMEELTMQTAATFEYDTKTIKGQFWTAMLGDSCERLKEISDNSIDLSVYSPPFADLYTYTDTIRDLGNSRNWNEFFIHYRFIIQEVLRVTKPGRLTCVHTSDIPAMASRDGYIGIRDFPGAVINAYETEGWVFVGRAFVQKNPQAQAIRVKSKALLFVQLRKDSSDSRPALIDQVLLFKKPGENAIPVNPVGNHELDNETWIEWAHGIWLGISESDTLQYSAARGEDDEKHICPLQLGTIERCIKLYSNPGETVLTPFGGIGSEGYTAVKFGRKAVLIELKPEYFDVLTKNMKAAEQKYQGYDIFSFIEANAGAL